LGARGSRRPVTRESRSRAERADRGGHRAGAARSGSLRRYFFGSAVIAICTTVAISVAALGVVSTIASDFALAGKPLDSAYLTPAKAGAPQTFLVIGDDHIGPTTTYATGAEQTVNGYHLLHADTFMLVRMDPTQGQTSILSIPRDLLVSFKWKGQSYTGKFNSTYSIGGPDLVKKVALATLPGLTINHVIDFNFASFLGLVDAIGCVYVDVDHRYLNDSDRSYQFINIQPGYQRLCSNQALSYVRYRHTDSDFVRVARQQDFIRQAKEQLGVWGFLSKWNPLAKAFGKAVWTDIRGTHEVANLLYLAAFSQREPIRQVPFQVSNPGYQIATSSGLVEDTVLSTHRLIQASLDDFLYIHPAAPAVEAASGHATHRSASGRRHGHAAGTSGSTNPVGTDDLYPLSSGVASQALLLSPDVPFPIFLPSVQTGPATPNDSHAYTIGDEQHHLHYGYRVDWSTGSEGEYYGIEGMDWTTPPLFANPSATERIDGRTYMFINDGAHIHDIGWLEDRALYWISNTLNESLTNSQMLAIAKSAQAAGS
jgi:LCP family protein required for cell wall assembly